MWRRRTGWVKGVAPLSLEDSAFSKQNVARKLSFRLFCFMASKNHQAVNQLEDLTNIGKSLASDLRQLGILHPQDLLGREPLFVFRDLAPIMAHRHDPCVFYTLLAVQHFLRTGGALPWWKYTDEGKAILQSQVVTNRC